jgi:hypothetical protein
MASFREICEYECAGMKETGSLSTMSLSYDSFDSIILLTKKKYIMSKGGDLIPQGVSIVRRDREKLVNVKIMEVCKAVLTNSIMVVAARRVNALIDSHRCALATGKSHISQCSMIVRRRGSMYNEHVGVDMFGDPIIHSTLLDNVSDTVVVYHALTLIKK